jgi:hypothetical protein
VKNQTNPNLLKTLLGSSILLPAFLPDPRIFRKAGFLFDYIPVPFFK